MGCVFLRRDIKKYMSQEVRQLAPKMLWAKFADLNAVPRPSKKEARVIQFIVDFGHSLGLETSTDAVGNVIIRKAATATTLGADNGIGVATIMALLESTTIAHPPLEALFTIDEETGMTGAMGLESGVLQGAILLNLDTEEDDEIGIGCAGGIDVTATRSYEEEKPAEGGKGYHIAITGLQGGHSGMDIHIGLGNANKLMNTLLFWGTEATGLQIASIDGGSLRNAIPRESFAEIVVPAEKEDLFKTDFKAWSTALMEGRARIANCF